MDKHTMHGQSRQCDDGQTALDLASWDHKPGDPERYGCRDFGTREDVRLSDVNQPSAYERRSEEEKVALQRWIQEALVSSNEMGRYSSYGLKHDFQYSERGFYVTNGVFKGAMLAAGYQPLDRTELNWQFKYSCDPELLDRSLGRVGREAV